MDFVWIAVWLALAINFWESSAITNKNNRGSKAQEERVRNFRHVENPTAYSNSDWEVGLRESINQALLRENYRVPDLRHRLLSAPLIGKHDTATPFGDVAIVARGRLYATIGGDFVFVQEPFPSGCHSCRRHRRRCTRSRCHQQVAHPHHDEQLVALWTVKRLRHRDYDHGYRYETEYTISPIGPLHDDALIAGINPLDYPLPGHVFVVKHSAGTAPPVPPPVVYNQRPPHHHFRPEVPLGVGPDGNEHFLHSYPGFYTTSPYKTTEDPKEIELYKILVQALAAKTSTTNKIEDGPHRFSLNNLYTTEDSFTPLVQLPTGEMVPLTSATSQAPQPPKVFTTQDKATTSVLQMAPGVPTDLSPVESPASITTVHYFAAANEDTSQTPGDVKENTSTYKPSTDGADFLFPLETTTAAPNTLYKAKTGPDPFPEQSVAPTRQSKLYHATFSAKKTSSATSSTSSIPSTTNASSPTTTPTTQATIALETSKTTPTSTAATTISETTTTTRIPAAAPMTTTSITTPMTTTPERTPPATLATTPTKPTANGASRTIKLPPPTNLILKTSTTSKLDRPTTYRTKFTGPKASARFFPTTYKSSSTEQTAIGNTTAITSSTTVMTSPTTVTSSTTPPTTELMTLSSESSTTNTETMMQTAAVSTVSSPMSSMTTGIDRKSTITTSQYTTTEPTSMKTTTEDEDMEEMKFVLNPIPITPVKMTLVPESTATDQIQTSTTDLQTTKELPATTKQETSTATSQVEERQTPQSMSSSDHTTFKTTMTSGITTEASSGMTEAVTSPTTEETTDITNTKGTAETTNEPSTTTEENTMLKMFNDLFNQNKPGTSPTVEDKTTEGITNVSTVTSTSSTTTEENMVVRMFNNLFNDNKSGTVEETEAVTNTSTAMTTEASSATTEKNMIKMFKDFLEEKTENKTPAKKDYTSDDIFGILKNSEKPTVTTTTKAVESQFAGELFGNRRRSPQIYPPDLSLTKPTKIIYSDFYEASTTPMTDTEEEPEKPLTSQSYMTSISFKVNKKTKMAAEVVREERGMPTESVSTTENGMEDKETRKAFNDAALQLVNHVRSINYLNGVNSISSTAHTKYKRRRTYVPKGRKVNIKRKI